MPRLALFLNELSDYTDKAISYFVFAIMVGMVVVTTLQVICRVFFSALSWSEEIARYLLVWGTFFAATLAYKRRSHIVILFAVEALPKKIQSYVNVLTTLLSVFFMATLVVYGFKIMAIQSQQISPAMSIPMRYIYSCIPVSMIIMLIHTLGSFFEVASIESGKESNL